MTAGSSSPDLDRQYDRVLQEYRFQVQLNWDRTKHYLTFNTLLFGAAIALYKDGTKGVPQAGVAVLLAFAALNSYFGQRAVKLGHEYYRSVRATKTALEKALGLEQYEILSTPGMRREHDVAAGGTPGAGSGRFAKITTQVIWLLGFISACSTIAAIYAVYAAYLSGFAD